jgi:hypothetical protein
VDNIHREILNMLEDKIYSYLSKTEIPVKDAEREAGIVDGLTLAAGIVQRHKKLYESVYRKEGVINI